MKDTLGLQLNSAHTVVSLDSRARLPDNDLQRYSVKFQFVPKCHLLAKKFLILFCSVRNLRLSNSTLFQESDAKFFNNP